MAKPKNQPELAIQFAEGATEGKVGHLLIHGNVIYNSEEADKQPDSPEYKVIAVRLSEKVALNNISAHGGTTNYHRTVVIQALQDKEYAIIDTSIASSKHSDGLVRIHDGNHDLENVRGELQSELKGYRDDLAEWEAKLAKDDCQGNREGVGILQDRVETTERKLRAISQFLGGQKSEEGKVKLDILTQLPEILEKAVKEKHVDEDTLQDAIRARDEVRRLIDEVDNYLAIIMALPKAAPDVTLTGQQLVSQTKEGSIRP